MIQVDVLWSFGIGAQFAAFAANNLKHEKSPFVNKYFIYTILYLSIFFAPSGIYLLWGYTGWETMFMIDLDFHPIVPTIFVSSNVWQGVLGFWISWNLIQKGLPHQAHTLWILSYMSMFTILGLGYRRFTFPGTLEDWRSGQWELHPISDYFNLDVCWVLPTLLIMAVVILPPIYYPMLFWPREESKKDYDQGPAIDKWALTFHVGKVYFYTTVIGIMMITFYLNIIADDAMRDYLKQDTYLGYHAPLGGFVLAQIIFVTISWWPYFLLPADKIDSRVQNKGLLPQSRQRNRMYPGEVIGVGKGTFIY
jgi:hypothetical protein